MAELEHPPSASSPEAGGSGDAGGHPPPSTQDALELLFADHRRIDALLDDCARLAVSADHSEADRSGLLARLGALVGAHATMEHELFYPALRDAERLVAEAEGEHLRIAQQLRELSAPDLSAADFGTRVDEFATLLREHVSLEELRLFPAALTLDLQALGTRLALRRGELLGDQGVD